MSLSRTLETELDRPNTTSGRVKAESGGSIVEVDVVELDRLGARVGGIKVRRGKPGDVATQAMAAPGNLRHLGEGLTPIEVEPSLGGAVLRSAPEEMDGGEFWQLSIGDSGREAELGRYQVGKSGKREQKPFTLTREHLRRTVDGMEHALEGRSQTEPSTAGSV